jgi:KUP system potassium uptake protein
VQSATDAEDEPSTSARGPRRAARTAGAALALGALGVVFGDIGTSPLYALQTAFTANDRAVGTSETEVYGVISLVFWTITLVVSVKYVSFVMRADNGGEGGILALTALVQGARLRSARAKVILIVLGILGASLFYGDGMITPAISVLSAVEGLEVADPGLDHLVVPFAVAVLVGLFVIQRFGTGAVGRLFGPVMVVWFVVLAALGIDQIAQDPDVLRALSPSYAVEFFADHGDVAFVALGSVVLVVTGAEALYADMGHFGRPPIRRAWFFVVFPALTLNYLGQGSLIVSSPSSVENPFYLLAPEWAQLPMVVLATVATVIASQAVISGVFSVTRQAVQLGFLPRVAIRHTSAEREGRIYVPAVNWGLLVAVVALVVGFGSSQSLGAAYGVAVTGTFMLTTILLLVVARVRWQVPIPALVLGGAAFLTFELALFSSTLTKVLHGGWAPLLVALVAFMVLTTWRRGRALVVASRTRVEGPLREFVAEVAAREPPLQRVPGTGVFLNVNPETTPLALRANIERNHVLHEHVVLVSVQIEKRARVPVAERRVADDLGGICPGMVRLSLRFGFHEPVDVPAALRRAVGDGVLARDADLEQASYFLSGITLESTPAPGMSRLRKRLYLALYRNAASSAAHFGLPADRTVMLGERIAI